MMSGKGKRRLEGWLFALRRYLAFFLLMAFVISCCMLLFLNELSAATGIALTKDKIESAAKLTFVNILFLSLLCTVIDGLRRKWLVERPVRTIVGAAEQIMKGDFSVRIPPLPGIENNSGFDVIADYFNRMAQELSGTETLRTDFIANVPTEEVFCAPHRERVNGIVYGTKPYVYNGQLIEGWHVTFKDGKVVEHGAEKNASLLAELLSTDENACRIGEIALVPASSPINQSGVLFYNTLFDENAACHIAFGAGYPTNIKGGSKMNRTELLAKGLNDSAIHEDVMIGAPDTNVIGTTKDGKEVTIFTNGEWAF